VRSKFVFGTAIIAAALYLYAETKSALRSPLANEDNQVGQVEYESVSDISVPIEDVRPTVQTPTPGMPPRSDKSLKASIEDNFLLTVEAKENVEATVYALVSGAEMPTYGYVNDFSCELNSCSMGIHLVGTSRLSSNAAKIMINLNAALRSADATSDVQVGLVSARPDESGEGVIRLVTMERRPSKYNVTVDEITGAFTTTTNDGKKEGSISQ